MLDVCSHPDPELFKMAVWTVGKVAYSATLVHRDAANDQRLQQVYEQFVAVLSHRCRFPDGWDSCSFEERNAFKATRFDIEDVLRDCCPVLGPQKVLSILTQQLRQAAQATNGAAGGDWRGVEAAYHCMGALKDEHLPRGFPGVVEVRPSSLSAMTCAWCCCCCRVYRTS